MDIDHLMPKFSPRVRAALAITSFIGDVIVEADNHRRETSVPPPDPADDFDDFEAALERFVSGDADALEHVPPTLRPYLRLWETCSNASRRPREGTQTPVNDATYREPGREHAPTTSAPVPPTQDALQQLDHRVTELEAASQAQAKQLADLEAFVRLELSTTRMFERCERLTQR